jgi:formylmethanofuran dehydrogenase subunit E
MTDIRRVLEGPGRQVTTRGRTFGKGLIERTQDGKWAMTLVDRASGKAVRVSVRPEVIQASFSPSPPRWCGT